MKSSKLSYVKVWKVLIFGIGIVTAGLLSLQGCDTKQKPSLIIVAFDRLAFNSVACSEEKNLAQSGFSVLCKEALRFTHAYTTSTQPAAAMGSLLSGTYPYVHGLHRSNVRIRSKQKLLSEVAEQQGYRSAFFSGSPEIMKKTGLAKAFDYFDDLSFLDNKNYINSFKFQTEMALSWISKNNKNFVTIIHNAELEDLSDAEADVTTLEKLDEQLAHFFATLKERNLWETNYVIVVGLQGQSIYNRPNETIMSNLHTENTNVSLFVKPPRQKGDDGMSSKVDTFLNIADLGWSLMKTIDPEFLMTLNEKFPIEDFSYLWKNPRQPIANTNDRKILVEATDPWKNEISTRYSIVMGNLVYIENLNDELFNSLNDGLETIDISVNATPAQNDFKNENRKLLSEIRGITKQSAWKEFKTEYDEWVNSNRNFWSNPNARSEIFENELKRYIKTEIKQPLTVLMLQHLTTAGKQDSLKKLNIKIDQTKSQTEKEAFFEETRRQSMNLALENLWGLWDKNKNLNQSTVIKEYQ